MGSRETVSTMDIFPTVLKLARGVLPTDRDFDGIDLTALLFAESDSQFEAVNGGPLRECLSFYGGTTGADCSSPNRNGSECPGLWAVRCGALKAHFVTRHSNWTLDAGTLKGPQIRDPPLLFDLAADPKEQNPISSESARYREAMPRMERERARMEQSVDYAHTVNEVLRGTDEEFVLCCDERSQLKWPQFPKCTCNPENWQQFVCEPVC